MDRIQTPHEEIKTGTPSSLISILEIRIGRGIMAVTTKEPANYVVVKVITLETVDNTRYIPFKNLLQIM